MLNEYNEVVEILNHIPEKDVKKIPEEMIEMFRYNINPNYNFTYDPRKTLDEQGVSEDAKTIIAILFRDYWATPKQREKIKAKENYDRLQIEKEKQKKYNVDNLFKRKN